MKTLLAVGFIWAGCVVAWVVLGSAIVIRTGEATAALDSRVQALWGPPRVQLPPRAFYRETRKVKDRLTNYDAQNRLVVSIVERDEVAEHDISLERSDIVTRFALEHRRKGLLWFPTYEVEFKGRYAFQNNTSEARDIELVFYLEKGNVIYDGFTIQSEDQNVVESEIRNGEAMWSQQFLPGEIRGYLVSYKSRGIATWHYGDLHSGLAGSAGRARNFVLSMETNFADVNFPPGTLSPSRRQAKTSGWSGYWKFDSIVTSAPIGIELPQKLNPGPLASKITFFAPVGLLFFFFVVAVLAIVQGRNIHPMNYFFFGCAFFAFHLLFAYLIDHLAIMPSFALASAVSVFLVTTYARLFVGWRFSLREMALSQLVYLVLFSFTFFWQGFTGLAITIGAILTLFIMMQITGRHDWRKAGSTRVAEG